MIRPIFGAVAGLVLAMATPAFGGEAPKRPNFLIIVADDLGYSDIGAFGGEIDTPNLDALAARALKFTGFHTAPACSPTRAMLLTGLDHHEAGLGTMSELIAPDQVGKTGHEGYLRSDTASLAELLGASGYRTHYSGKWHLGTAPEQDPHSRGFQTSFALLQGGHNHFGLQVAKEPGARGASYTEDGQHLAGLPANFYSSDYFATKLIAQLKSARTMPNGNKPFFAYLSFTAPHFPLMAPPEVIAKYRGRYDGGYDELRERRLRRQIALGLLDPKVVPHDMDLAPLWNSLTPDQRARESRRMEVYAAMVDQLDSNVGRVIKALKDSGEYDNTIILFLADNGSEGSILSDPSMGLLNAAYAAGANQIDNIGSATSYEYLGPGWAEAATAPSWRVKAFESEGGTRVVSFLAGPAIAPGMDGAYTNVMDVVPTFLDLARVPKPGNSFAGRAVKPIRGKSWAAWLQGRAPSVYSPNEPVGGELFGGRALRQGDWKITDVGDGVWRLFNIAADPGETNDLSPREPARKARLIAAWDAYSAQVGVALPKERQPIIDRPIRR